MVTLINAERNVSHHNFLFSHCRERTQLLDHRTCLAQSLDPQLIIVFRERTSSFPLPFCPMKQGPWRPTTQGHPCLWSGYCYRLRSLAILVMQSPFIPWLARVLSNLNRCSYLSCYCVDLAV